MHYIFLQGREAVIRVENDEEMGEYSVELEKACADILEKTGIHSLYFPHMPKGMQLSNYIVSETLEDALMFYQYENTVLTVDMMKKGERSNKTQLFDGEVLDEFDIETKFGVVSVMEIVSPEEECDYVAQIVYDNCQYTFYGVIQKKELVAMIEYMNFY